MSICRACLKRDKALDVGLPEENWHIEDSLVLAIRTTDINYSRANGNDEENLMFPFALLSFISVWLFCAEALRIIWFSSGKPHEKALSLFRRLHMG